MVITPMLYDVAETTIQRAMVCCMTMQPRIPICSRFLVPTSTLTCLSWRSTRGSEDALAARMRCALQSVLSGHPVTSTLLACALLCAVRSGAGPEMRREHGAQAARQAWTGAGLATRHLNEAEGPPPGRAFGRSGCGGQLWERWQHTRLKSHSGAMRQRNHERLGRGRAWTHRSPRSTRQSPLDALVPGSEALHTQPPMPL